MKKAALILGELVLKCMEDTTLFPWPIKSLDLKEKQYLKLRSLFLSNLLFIYDMEQLLRSNTIIYTLAT